MAIMIAMYNFYFAQPLWLTACALVVPIVWLAWRHLTVFGSVRRVLAIVLRCVVIIILVALLARPKLARENQNLSLMVVLDRSQSIPSQLQQAGLEYLNEALTRKIPGDRLAVVDVAEAAGISKLPSSDISVRQRNTTLNGQQSKLADGVQMAMAIAPADTAVRILLISDGNQTSGDLKEVARTAAANGIPIDVLPLRYEYDQEVIFNRLAGPARARSGQTISLRFILSSTAHARGRLLLQLNGKPVDLAPDSPEIAVATELKPGTNVKTISIPVGTRGMHEFEAVFVPDDPAQDRIVQNNRAGAMTFVAGPGHVLLVDTDGSTGLALNRALQNSDIDVRYCTAVDFPDNLARLMDCDAIILVNTDCGSFTFQQQELICRYVGDLGGGLIMTGGPQSFGAGGWIGSPVAEILPVDLDPPQKKQLPKGALVLIMHSCEMPQGNLWGERIAIAAVKTLSRLDLVGILAYNWQGGNAGWVFPLGPTGDKKKVISAIRQMQVGDMPGFSAHIQAAYQELKDCDAAQKHIIIISDGDPSPPGAQLLAQLKQAGITCTGVAVFPHSPADVQSLLRIAKSTGGRFYNVKDPQQLPQIFIKEAQVVRRALIVEETISPQITYSLSEITKGLSLPLPNLDGYVLTGPGGGLSHVILAGGQADPILATGQAGLGRCVVFTSSADGRWASDWLGWGGFERFWEQVVRWAAKPAQSSDCEVFADVQGRNVTLNVEAIDAEGKFMQLAHIDGQIIAPDVSTSPLQLTQVGPGQFRGRFQGSTSGSYIVNLRYRKAGQDKTHFTQTTVTVPFAPEFRDLSDNAALLEEVSEITSGRVLPSDPSQERLFDHTGVKFPETQLPLTQPLMLIWLAVFLLDVAVRRIAIDFRAIARRIAVFIRRPVAERKADRTLHRLRLAQQKLRTRLTARTSGSDASRSSDASRRYEAAEQYTGDLPNTNIQSQIETPTDKPSEKPTEEKTKETEASEDETHIQQLLRAKRQAAGRQQDDKKKPG